MTDLQSIEVREGWKRYYLILTILWILFLSLGFIIPSQRQESITFFFSYLTIFKLPFILYFIAPIFIFLYYYFDKRVKLRIDSNGIWTRKYQNILWDDIWYFSTSICKMQSDGDIYYIKIKLKDTEERVDKTDNISLRRMDKSFTDIRDILTYYANKYQILDLGHDNEA